MRNQPMISVDCIFFLTPTACYYLPVDFTCFSLCKVSVATQVLHGCGCLLLLSIHRVVLFIYLFSCASTSLLFLNGKGYNPWDQRKFSIRRLEKMTRLEKQGV